MAQGNGTGASTGLLDSKLADVAVKVPDIPGLQGLPETVSIRDVSTLSHQAVNVMSERLVDFILAALLIGAGWLFSRWLATTTQRALVRAKIELTVASFLGSVARYVMFLVVVVLAFNILGVGLASAVAVFGAIGLAVAFALRGTLSHVAAGIMLIVNRPFKVGDWIQLDSLEGLVKRITLFNTEINTLTNQRVFVPNTKIWENVLLNHTYNETRMVETQIGIGLQEDGARVKQILLEAALSHPKVLTTPAPLVGAKEIGPFAMIYIVRVWLRTQDYFDVRYDMAEVLRAAVLKAGLDLPYPTHVQMNVEPGGAPERAAGTRLRQEEAK